MENKTHIRELSSIRGIAAIVVVLGHVFKIVNQTPTGNVLAGSDISNAIFNFLSRTFNGPAAVEIFFVLSGLVLSLSLERSDGNRRKWASSFYIKRIFRIYPALWVSLALALVLLQYERSGCAQGFCTKWAAGAFQEEYTVRRIIFSFMGMYVHFNGPMWSLRVELFYSLLFPVIFLSLRNPKTRLISFLVILALAVLPISRFWSVHYALAFALGSVIPLIPIDKKNLPYRVIALLAVIALIFSRQILCAFNFEEKTFEIIEMFSSFVIICLIFHKKMEISFLRNNLSFYLGEISYSIYLLHYPLLFALLYAMEKVVGVEAIHIYPNLFTVVLGCVTLIVTISLSALNFRFVEMPFQSLGRAYIRRMG